MRLESQSEDLLPEKPIPEYDPVVGKSYALHYLVATVILIATLFWALWDESFGQRPWKAYQHEWKSRYGAFLKTATSKSSASLKDIENGSDYQALEQAYKQAQAEAAPREKAINQQLRDVNGRLLAVRAVFTERRA